MVGQLQTRLLAGRYRLEELLGGTDAEVYRAIDEQLGRTVAVKIARSGSSGFEPERFANEMRVLAGLRHPGLVTLYDAGTADDGAPYLVMQYVAGVTLAARLRDGLPAAEEVRRIGAALAGALDHLHADGIVHRDIKPANVLISDDGEVYLADLGIARARDTAGLTDTGLVVGTPAYLAPEQVAGRTVGPACDLYALGLVLLECFTGRREYQGTPAAPPPPAGHAGGGHGRPGPGRARHRLARCGAGAARTARQGWPAGADDGARARPADEHVTGGRDDHGGGHGTDQRQADCDRWRARQGAPRIEQARIRGGRQPRRRLGLGRRVREPSARCRTMTCVRRPGGPHAVEHAERAVPPGAVGAFHPVLSGRRPSRDLERGG